MRTPSNDSIISNKTTHSVCFYKNDYFLIKSTIEFLLGGLIREDYLIIIASKKHLKKIDAQLQIAARQLGLKIKKNQILTMDANHSLSLFTDEHTINVNNFYEHFEPMINNILTYYPGVTAYGEMVNILCEKKRFWDAMKLEKLWCKLAEKYYPINIHCGYAIENFNEGKDVMELTETCHHHTNFEAQSNIILPEDMSTVKTIPLEKHLANDMALQSEMLEIQIYSEENQTLQKEIYKLYDENLRLNMQLASIVNQLKISSHDAYMILNRFCIPIIYIDNQLRIYRFNPQFDVIFKLISQDIGRPISDFDLRFHEVDLTHMLRDVVTSNTPKAIRVIRHNIAYIVCILPVGACQSFPDGVVVIFIESADLSL